MAPKRTTLTAAAGHAIWLAQPLSTARRGSPTAIRHRRHRIRDGDRAVDVACRRDGECNRQKRAGRRSTRHRMMGRARPVDVGPRSLPYRGELLGCGVARRILTIGALALTVWLGKLSQ